MKTATVGLAELEAALRRDLALLDYPANDWVKPRIASDGRKILDVLIVGGGQSGLAAAFGLMRERVRNILVIDENPKNAAGPWRTFARMITLRTPKHLTGPDLGIPNLTIRAWYEAQHGPDSWEAMGLIPKETWADYLNWYRDFLRIPVRHNTRAGAIRWLANEDCFSVPLIGEKEEEVLARKIVLATGIDGSGRWTVPEVVRDSLPKEMYSHTRDDIDFAHLVGKRVGVLGAGASAFDNAAVALEAGASEVHLFFRRSELIRVNPYRWAEFTGFLKHHGALPDEMKWRFIDRICKMGQLPPADTFRRAKEHAGFRVHPGTEPTKFESNGSSFTMYAEAGNHQLDYLIAATGFKTDLAFRPELSEILSTIALWRDRYTPPTEEANADLSRHPYLGACFEFTEKNPGEAPWLSRIFNYTFGCLPSLGFGGASISGMKYSIPRLVGGITEQLYVEDAAHYYETLANYDRAEF